LLVAEGGEEEEGEEGENEPLLWMCAALVYLSQLG